MKSFAPSLLLFFLSSTASPAREDDTSPESFAPLPSERQLPKRMHSQMRDLPRITVGQANADITGTDNRALQAAVEYIAALGGGTVEIGPGTYVMRDSLHLRPNVTVRGTKDQTVLRKADAVSSPMVRDGDFGEEQATVKDGAGFDVGCGVAVWDKNSGGFHTTVARITGRTGNTFSFDKPLNADCMAANGATAATVFPVVSGYDLENCRLENLTIDGNKEHNPSLNGCRGGGIFLYRGFGTVIENCTVQNYHGDGISFQQSNDVIVRGCVSRNNAGLGLHPGSGSQRPLIEKCTATANGEDGLFLCWRVRHGTFQDNILEGNARYGISIGHKDTDNLLQRNQVRLNEQAGVCFRNESEAMAGHRNRLEQNVIENNGIKKEAPGILIRGETNDLTFTGNIIRDTRPAAERKQTTGIRIEEKAGTVTLDRNTIEAPTPVDDRRKAAPPGKPAATAPLLLNTPATIGDATVTLTNLECLPYIENEYTRRFIFDSAANPKLRQLRNLYTAEDIKGIKADEFGRQRELLHWVHDRFKKFGRPSTPAHGALEILKGIDDGHTFFCTQYAELLVSTAACMGWVNRPLALRRHQGANKNGGSTEHTVTEMWSNQFSKWIMFDPTSDLYVEKNGMPLNAWEIRQEWFYHDGKDLTFIVGRNHKPYKKADLPVTIGQYKDFGPLTLDPDEPDKYGFIGYIPNTNLMDAGYDYGQMFITKDKLCDGTNWHTRTNPAAPATDPYFPIGQAALSLSIDNGKVVLGLKTMTPNFKCYQMQTDTTAGAWEETKSGAVWNVHPGSNWIRVWTVNQFGVTGPQATAAVIVK